MPGETQHHIQIGDAVHAVTVTASGDGTLLVGLGDRLLRVTVDALGGAGALALTIDGVRHPIHALTSDDGIDLLIGGDLISTTRVTRGAGTGGGGASGPLAIRAPMPGVVKDCFVADGDTVEEGAALLVLEAMKMNNQIRAARAGTVQGVAIAAGQRVNKGDPLLTIV